MQEKQDIASRLLGSESVASLRAEQEVVAAFKARPWWRVEHGPFFRDRATGKLRELDVRARRHWSTRGADSMTATVEEGVEVKSIRDYHLVFAPEPNGEKESRAQRGWIGYNKERFARFVLDGGLSSEVVSRVVARFGDISYPDGSMLLHDLVVDPPHSNVLRDCLPRDQRGGRRIWTPRCFGRLCSASVQRSKPRGIARRTTSSRILREQSI